jgi:2-polyprenyl-3-methyl-5-hydroxy-6-metoxy-1,4-benzoquinol methylase
MESEIQWTRTETSLICTSPAGRIFEDTVEHWQNGVLRLLNLTEETGRAWVEAVAAEALAESPEPFLCRPPEDRIRILERAWQRSAGSRPSLTGYSFRALSAPVDTTWFSAIRNDSSVRVVGSKARLHGVLAEFRDGHWELVKPAPYEEEYFEGSEHGVGYQGYRQQGSWRLEKAARLVRQIRGIGLVLGLDLASGARLLDVGSGYGYFRKAAQQSGWQADGTEISDHAASVARADYGFETFVGTLSDFYQRGCNQPYDVLTMFDVIEHVDDPVALLRVAGELLKPGGICVIRTPNLLSIEAGVFKNDYHSLKLEHLHYFSSASLCFAMECAGLIPAFLTSESHLLKGFLGPALNSYACNLRGSDLFAVARKA